MSRPFASVVPSLDGDVLMVLSRTTRPLAGREIGRLVGRGSPAGVQKVLRRLADQGLVSVQEAGVALLYRLNREHVAATAVLALAELRSELFRRIREQTEHWPVVPVSVSVFGSAARGDGDVDSDVDVLIVRPDEVDADDRTWREQVSALAEAIVKWSGNHASMIEVSAHEARAMSTRQEPIVDELVRDAFPIAGRSVTDVLAGRTG